MRPIPWDFWYKTGDYIGISETTCRAPKTQGGVPSKAGILSWLGELLASQNIQDHIVNIMRHSYIF